MIHLIGHLFKAAHQVVKHSSKVATVGKSVSTVTPLAWMQAGKAHQHTTKFWTKIAHRGFKFWS